MIDPFRAIRRLERFLFRGVPEHPESTYQRDVNSISGDRLTGRSQLNKSRFSNREQFGKIIAEIHFYPEEQRTKIIRK